MLDLLPDRKRQIYVLGRSAYSTSVLAHGSVVFVLVVASLLSRTSQGEDPPVPGVIEFVPETIIAIDTGFPPPRGDSLRAGGHGGSTVTTPPSPPPPPITEVQQPAALEDLNATQSVPPEAPAEAASSVSDEAGGARNVTEGEGEGNGDGSGDGSGSGDRPGTQGVRDGVGTGPLGGRGGSDDGEDVIWPGPGVEPPVLIRRVEPEYPVIARISRVEGVVILQGVIGTDGRVESLQLLKSIPMLDRAAIEAVQQWRYKPSRQGSRPVKVYVTIRVEFRLD